MRRRRTSSALLALCLLLSAWLHAIALFFLVRWWEPESSTPGEQITYLDFSRDDTEAQRPEDKRPDESEPPEPEPDKPKPPEPKKKKEKKKKEPNIELEELPEPEPEEEKKPEPEPEPEEEPPTPPPDFVLEQLKMVEQPDELDEKEAPEDANYLSNVNRDVQQETRAKVTNLVQDAVEQKAHQLEPSEVKEQGTADETKIAEEQEHRSRLDRQAPKTKPEPEEKRTEQNDPKPQSLLAMRELEHRDHKMAQEAHEALADEADDGTLQAEQKHQSSLKPQEQRARVDKHDRANRFRLSQNDLQALFGKDVDAQKSYEAKRQSKTKGVWEDQRAHWQSPLENMVPEVQVGNQTALRSRKHPFARYIAQMHRKIHEAWAWGYLEQLDTRGRDHPQNDYNLWTRIEIVLNSDGTIDKLTTVHFSGKLAFDAAAREVVYAQAPFPNPPREIISGDGKIYIHWAFHRDERACGTFGAQPFILDGAGRGDRPDPNVKIRAGRGESMPRRLKRGHNPAPAVAEGPSRPQAPAAPPSAGSGGSGGAHAGGGSAPSSPPPASPNDPAARKVANEWLAYFSKGAIDKAISRSSLPFYSGDSPIARTRAELRDVMQTMSEESRAAGRPKAAKMMTAAELRKLFGSVPAGVQEGTGRVYGLTQIGGEYVTVMLEKKFGSWRVVGITR